MTDTPPEATTEKNVALPSPHEAAQPPQRDIFEHMPDGILADILEDTKELGFPRVAAMAHGIIEAEWDAVITTGESVISTGKQELSQDEKKAVELVRDITRARGLFAQSQLERISSGTAKGRVPNAVAWLLERVIPKEFGEQATQSSATSLLLRLRQLGEGETEITLGITDGNTAALPGGSQSNEGALITESRNPVALPSGIAEKNNKNVPPESDEGGMGGTATDNGHPDFVSSAEDQESV